jgi:lipoate-protein ligase A
MERRYTLHKTLEIYLSTSFKPEFNLSVESWLMKKAKENTIIMFLWQNQNTIVIGRNQNPYKECDIPKLEIDNVKLIRRFSGGGAVYHDMGNLNFTFISSDKNYNVQNNIQIIINALSKFGIKCSFNGRNDIIADGRKFSGNAFFSEDNINCHHGTILINVDIEKLSKYLTVSNLKLESKGIDSVVSRVINLKQLNDNISVEYVKKALISSFECMYNTESTTKIISEDTIELNDSITKFKSWQWNYSQSPNFSLQFEEKFEWGIIEFNFNASDGIIRECKIYTDSIELDNFKILEAFLVNKELKCNIIEDSVKNIIQSENIKKDICNMISKRIG